MIEKLFSIQLAIYLVFLFFTVGCTSQKNGIKEKQISSPIETTSVLQSTEIPSLLYLENRVSNCDSAMAFMKSAITPGFILQNQRDSTKFDSRIWKGFYIKGESKNFLNHPKRIGHQRLYNNRRFYISMNCLIGKDVQTILDIFVGAKYHKLVLSDIKSQETSRNHFSIEGQGFSDFNIVFVDNHVSEALFNYAHISH